MWCGTVAECGSLDVDVGSFNNKCLCFGIGTASVLRCEMLHLVICFLYHKHVRLPYVHIMLK